MAERIIANLTLDTYQRNKIPPLVIPQHDYGARYIRVRITEQGENVSVASGSVVSIIAKRMADGQSAAFLGSVNADGSVLVPVTQWMLDAPSDDVDCHVAVTGTGYQYSTTSFVISPQERENPSYLEEDDPRVNIVEEALIKVVEEADRAEEQADLAQSAASTAASDAKEAARQEVEQLVGQLGIVQSLGNSRMAVVSQAVTTGLYNRNAKRIANLEQGFNEQFETDSSVAYVKDVPENALPYAEVKKVGGMTRKTANVARISTPKSGYFYDVNGTESEEDSRFIAFYALNVRENTTYSASCNLGLHSIWFSDDNSPISEAPQTDHFTTPSGCTVLRVSVRNTSGVADTSAFKWFMLNEGSTALPYEPYFEGLRSAKVTEVESVGVNIWDEELTSGYYDAEDGELHYNSTFFASKNQIRVSPNTAYSIICPVERRIIYYDRNKKFLSGVEYNENSVITTPSNCYYMAFSMWHTYGDVYKNDIMINKGSTALPYTPYLHHTLPIPVEVRGSENLIPETSVVIGKYWEINANGTVFQENLAGYMCASEPLLVKPNNTYYVSSKQDGTIIAWAVWFVDENYAAVGRTEGWQATDGTFTVPSNCRYALFTARYNRESYQNNIMINEGTTALPYEPYSAVKGLDGYGLGVSDTVYNYIDYEKKQFVKRCASADLGTLDWTLIDGAFIAEAVGLGYKYGMNGICAKYMIVSNANTDKSLYMLDSYFGNHCIGVRDSAYTDAITFKAAMSGVMLVYELAEPIVTDISNLITEDNFIGVEGNGTLTFKNAYEYSVPSEVEYQLEV